MREPIARAVLYQWVSWVDVPVLTLCHCNDLIPLIQPDLSNGQARKLDQLDLGERGFRLDIGQAHGTVELSHRLDLDRRPGARVVPRIGEARLGDAHDPDDLLVADRMVEERLIARLHSLQVVARAVIAHAVP